jgi:hypothetical protein
MGKVMLNKKHMDQSKTVADAGDIISLFVFDTVFVSEHLHAFSWGGVFSTEDISEILELGQAIRSIRARLVAEGCSSLLIYPRFD